MSSQRKIEPFFLWFIILMVLLGLAGAALVIYGAMHPDTSVPLLPGYRNIARLLFYV